MKNYKPVPMNPQSTIEPNPNRFGIFAIHDASFSPSDFSCFLNGPVAASEPKLIEEVGKWLYPYLICIGLLLAIGCAPTIAPRAVHDAAPTYDGTQRNSGFLGFDSVGNGIITPRAFQRYQGLLSEYHTAFTPALGTNDWPIATATNTYIITPQELTYFATMSRWKKGQAP